MKIERGVMVMKDGKAWGVTYKDGHSTEYGWIAPEDAPIRDPRHCTKPTDVVHATSHYRKELATAQLVMVERRTEVVILSDNGAPRMRAVAPWKDFAGNTIHEGDIIQHPLGERGVVVFVKDEAAPGDQWRVDYGDGCLSRLCLQIGDKGQAVVVPDAE